MRRKVTDAHGRAAAASVLVATTTADLVVCTSRNSIPVMTVLGNLVGVLVREDLLQVLLTKLLALAYLPNSATGVAELVSASAAGGVSRDQIR